MGWDENPHSVWGLLIAFDLQQGDWLSLLFDIYRQVYWPPLCSLLSGVAFIIGGPTVVTARALSVISLMLLAPILYLATRRMPAPKLEMKGIIVLLLALSSPAMINWAALAMLEMPGLALITLAILAFFLLPEDGSQPGRCMFMGLTIAAAYMMKTNYGMLLGMALVITWAIDLRLRPHRHLIREIQWVVLPLCVVFAVWFAYPPKLAATLRALMDQPYTFANPYGWEALTFYPKAFVRMSGSLWMAALYVISVLAAFRSWRNRKIRFILVFVLMQFLLAELHQTKTDRHILPMFPALYLLAGHMLAAWWVRTRHDANRLRRWAAPVATVLVLAYAASLPFGISPPAASETGMEVVEYVISEMRSRDSTLVLGTRDIKIPRVAFLDWELITREKILQPPQAGTISEAQQERSLSEWLANSRIPDWLAQPVITVLSRAERPGNNRTYFAGLPGSHTDEGFIEYFAGAHRRGRFNAVVVMTSLNDQSEYPLSYLEPALQKAGLVQVSSRQFHNFTISVDVYR